MQPREFIDKHFAGNVSRAARELGVTRSAIYLWINNGWPKGGSDKVEIWRLKNTQPALVTADTPQTGAVPSP